MKCESMMRGRLEGISASYSSQERTTYKFRSGIVTSPTVPLNALLCGLGVTGFSMSEIYNSTYIERRYGLTDFLNQVDTEVAPKVSGCAI